MRFRHLTSALTCLALASPLAAQQPAAAPDSSGQPFVVERLEEHDRFEADGTGRRELAFRIHVVTEAALQAFGQAEYAYNSANEKLDVDYVRVLKPGGDTIVAPASAVLDMTGQIAREAPMFSDIREKVVTVPGLRVGDVLEAHLTWTDTTPLAPGRFWYTVAFSDDAIVLDQRLVLDVPRSGAVLVRTTGGPDPAVTEAAGRRVSEWRRRNLEVDTSALGAARRVARLRHAPPGMEVTNFANWEDVGRWYAGLERDREVPTPAIKAKADSLVRGRASRLDSIAAIYAYVSQEFRYVSVSFGIGRYQPHTAAEVLASEYGDCKDKHVLLASLLRAVGIASAPALVSMERDIDSTLPSPGQFDHVITFVPAGGDTLWLDATPGAAAFRMLDFELRGHLALVVPLDGAARLVRTPELPPFATYDSLDVDAEIGAARKLAATYRFTDRGAVETVMRSLLRQVPPERLNDLAHGIADDANLGGTASAAVASDPKDITGPVRFSFRLERADAITWSGQRATYALPLPRMRLPVEDTAAVADSLWLDVSQAAQTLHLRLPAGVSVQAPLDVTESRDFAEYRSSYRVRGDTVTVVRSLAYLVRALPPSRLADFLAFRRAVGADQDAGLTLTRSADAAAGAGGDVDAAAQSAWDAFLRRDFRGAIRLYRQVLARDPKHRDAWTNLGRAYVGLDLLDSARAAFLQAVAVDSSTSYAWNNLGLAEWRMGETDSAAVAFRREIAINARDRWAHLNLGQMAVERRWDSVAVAELRQAVAMAPNDPTGHVSLAHAYIDAGDSAEAKEEMDRALAIRPTASTLNSVAYALAEAGAMLDLAEGYARQAIDSVEVPLRDATLTGTDPRPSLTLYQVGAYWDTMGWILFRKGDVAGAERYLRAALLVTSGADGRIGDHLGQVYEREGRTADAVKAYALAKSAGNTSAETVTRLEALAGGRARAIQRVVEAGQGGVQELRTVRLPRLTRGSVAGEVNVLLGPGPKVLDVEVVDGTPGMKALVEKLRAAGASFPNLFPGGDSIQVPVHGLLTCSPAAGCTYIMMMVLVRGSVGEVVAPVMSSPDD